jgi:hypothetical protein
MTFKIGFLVSTTRKAWEPYTRKAAYSIDNLSSVVEGPIIGEKRIRLCGGRGR